MTSWYHSIELSPGNVTPGAGHQNIAATRTAMAGVDFTGCRVLDMACQDGLLSILAARRGAQEVIAWDRIKRPNCDWPNVKHVWGPLRHDVPPFDVVICSGLLYHTLDPLPWLLRARSYTRNGGLLILETAAYWDLDTEDTRWNRGRYYTLPEQANYWFPTIAILAHWFDFARLIPLTCSWFMLSPPIARIACALRAVPSVSSSDPWIQYHETCPSDHEAALTLAELIDWTRVANTLPPVPIDPIMEHIDFARLRNPLTQDRINQLSTLYCHDLI